MKIGLDLLSLISPISKKISDFAGLTQFLITQGSILFLETVISMSGPLDFVGYTRLFLGPVFLRALLYLPETTPYLPGQSLSSRDSSLFLGQTLIFWDVLHFRANFLIPASVTYSRDRPIIIETQESPFFPRTVPYFPGLFLISQDVS